jgi:hypothetical protein
MLNNDGKISEIKTAFQSDFTGTQVGRHSKRLRTTAGQRTEQIFTLNGSNDSVSLLNMLSCTDRQTPL